MGYYFIYYKHETHHFYSFEIENSVTDNVIWTIVKRDALYRFEQQQQKKHIKIGFFVIIVGGNKTT